MRARARATLCTLSRGVISFYPSLPLQRTARETCKQHLLGNISDFSTDLLISRLTTVNSASRVCAYIIHHDSAPPTEFFLSSFTPNLIIVWSLFLRRQDWNKEKVKKIVDIRGNKKSFQLCFHLCRIVRAKVDRCKRGFVHTHTHTHIYTIDEVSPYR